MPPRLSAREVADLAPRDSDLEGKKLHAAAAEIARGARRKGTNSAHTSSPTERLSNNSPQGSSSTPKGLSRTAANARSNEQNTPVTHPNPAQSSLLQSTPLVGTTGEPNPAGGSSSRSNTQQLSKMSSQRRGAARNGARGTSDDGAVNRHELWDDVKKSIAVIAEIERKAKAIKEKIIATELKMKQKKDNDISITPAEYSELEALYRESVKLAEEQKNNAQEESLLTRLQLLADLQKNHEHEESLASARNSSSRTSGVDYDGPSDSPVPSPAENRQVRKLAGSRTSSQPPRSTAERADGPSSETSERASKPKIIYAVGDEVAFKRKLPNAKPEELDWIQGEVVGIIGEGKSRRYQVKDIDPDAVSSTHKSSASQMVLIPRKGTPLGDYEVGRQVLALYPQATTFYRAIVKSTSEDGSTVKVVFEEEKEEKGVWRRLVLDHKG